MVDTENGKGVTYSSSGVDIDVNSETNRLVGQLVRSTYNEQVITQSGLFGGAISLVNIPPDYTKLLASVGFCADELSTPGVMAKNCFQRCLQQVAPGTLPIAFLDYLAATPLKAETIEQAVQEFCSRLIDYKIPLVGGETAEMPGMYKKDDYDLAGFAVGVVEKSKIIDGSSIKVGDIVIGLPSSGFHSNGYSLARVAIEFTHNIRDCFLRNETDETEKFFVSGFFANDGFVLGFGQTTSYNPREIVNSGRFHNGGDGFGMFDEGFCCCRCIHASGACSKNSIVRFDDVSCA